MATKKQEHISIQQIRDDLNGFVDGLAQGKSYTILRRSRPVATSVSGSTAAGPKGPKPGSKEAMKEFIDIAREIRSSAKPVFDPNKSIKELYKESMDKKYGISRRKHSS
jgi:antitoxin (DNA-binding transcriptional repressor) of toxin-antitoxin stability system